MSDCLSDPTFGGGVREGISRLDPLLEHRIRLGACVLLARVDRIRFAQLRDFLEATDGNLGAQMRKLEEAGYVIGAKGYENRKPVTSYSITPMGRTALQHHFAALDGLIRPKE